MNDVAIVRSGEGMDAAAGAEAWQADGALRAGSKDRMNGISPVAEAVRL